MPLARREFKAGLRASLPLLIAAMAMSILVYAGASMLAATQLPGLLRRALRYVPAAVLTAIWAPRN